MCNCRVILKLKMKTLAQMRKGVVKNKKKKTKGTKQTDESESIRNRKRSVAMALPLPLDEAAQLQKRARYLLVKLKLEQSLIDAYSAQGWKGQSREKIRPEKELLRAKNQILKFKLGIRDTVHQLDLLASVGKIDDSLISPDGSIHHEHIFCKKCNSQQVSEDNDIILCDGTCNCAFHQKCIDPPLATIDIPPEDEGWLCKYCDCKMEILEATNAYLGTQFSVDSTWQDIFKEEALLSNVGARIFNPEDQWPDDESGDSDYDPDRDAYDSSEMIGMDDSGLHEEISTGSSICSLESEALSESELHAGIHAVSSKAPSLHRVCATESYDNEIASGPRKRCAVDYQKLYDEMFGKDTFTSELISEDEDWDPSKRRRREKESDVASNLMTLCESEDNQSAVQTLESADNHLPFIKARKPPSRIPSDVVQKLRQAFAENELPSRDTKRKISELVGLEYGKVNKWFKNARYMALKKKKRETALDCSQKFDSTIDESTDVVVSKCSSTPILIHKKNGLKNFSWKANLMTLISHLKKQKLKNSLTFTEANLELSDDMSLKKHLLYLKANCRRKERVRRNTKQFQGQYLEMQMEHLYWIEAKLWKLKRELSTIQEVINNDSGDISLPKRRLVYVPIAELKEKA